MGLVLRVRRRWSVGDDSGEGDRAGRDSGVGCFCGGGECDGDVAGYGGEYHGLCRGDFAAGDVEFEFHVRADCSEPVYAPVGADGTIALTNNSGSTVHLIADTAGYYLAGAASVAGAFSSLTPFRQLDTRNGTGAAGAAAVVPWGTIRVKVTGRGGIPVSGVSAVAVNVTVTTAGYGGEYHGLCRGDFAAGDVESEFHGRADCSESGECPGRGDGTIALTNNSGSTVHLIADTAGHHTAGPAQGAVFTWGDNNFPSSPTDPP